MHYLACMNTSLAHALSLMLRRQRLILSAIIAFLPVIIPLATAWWSTATYSVEGAEVFRFVVDQLQVKLLAPLMALFFGSMLVAEDLDAQTIPYILTRPIPRSAWVAGKFIAYAIVTATMLALSITLTFFACTVLADFTVEAGSLGLCAHYIAVATVSLLGYGALAMALGAATRRPIIYAVLIFYGWEKLATLVPGVVDFLTLQKYVEALMPAMASERGNIELETALGVFTKEVYFVGAGKALAVLGILILSFVAVTVRAVREREYVTARSAGG